MRDACGLALGVLLLSVAAGPQVGTANLARIDDRELGEPFLLQINYDTWSLDGIRTFTTSRSRIVRLLVQGDVAVLRDEFEKDTHSGGAVVLANIPVRREGGGTVTLDLNAGFSRIALDEDRTGQDYFEREDPQEPAWLPLTDHKAISVARHGDMLVFAQSAEQHDGSRIMAHYYLSPYRPDSAFRPVEMMNLDHFGFYETYPQSMGGRPVFYAMKFGVDAPIVFALSSTIPERHRTAVRDGILYWNRALGRSLIRVIDAPVDVRAPNVEYNVVDWVDQRGERSATHIQSDPRTGQILHAHVFVLREATLDDDPAQQNDQMRLFVAHEIGHALGLRHNFGQGPTQTVMDYFRRPQELELGRRIAAGEPALPYDRDVVRHVYFGARLDLNSLLPFCTDGHPGCTPYSAREHRP